MTTEHNTEKPASIQTLVALLRWRAAAQPEKLAYAYLPDGETDDIRLTYAQLDTQARAVASWLQAHGQPGDRVLLLYPPGLDYIAAYFGCLYAGFIAVPAYPPRLNRPSPRIQGIVRDAGATLAIADTQILTSLSRRFEHMAELAGLKWLNSETITSEMAAAWREPAINANTIAFLQYTSGSTSAPKGVVVSHGNLMHNLKAIAHGFRIDTSGIGIFWLPSYHDMGLIGGILEPMYIGGPTYLMAPAAFLQRPFRWLQAIGRYQGTISGAPNFAYKLCVEKITPEQRDQLDLSSWQLAFSGAEPVNTDTMREFAATFAPHGFNPNAFYPCYGLAESTLIAAGGNGPGPLRTLVVDKEALTRNLVQPAKEESASSQTLVSCGQTILDQTLTIVQPETEEPAAPGEIGEIWLSGPSVAQGYWGLEEQTAVTFHATLPNTPHRYLRTGDLGFLHHNNLYITGRLKDLIIIRGRNLYPQDIEHTALQAHESLEPGAGAAFAITANGEEKLALVYELKRQFRHLTAAEIATAVRTTIAQEHGVQLHTLTLIKPLTIPKTSSGKIRRAATRQQLLDGELAVVSQWTAAEEQGSNGAGEQGSRGAGEHTPHPTPHTPYPTPHTAAITAWLINQIAAQLKLPPSHINPNEPFTNYGLDSLQAVTLVGDLESWLGRDLPPTLIWDYPTITALAAHLATPHAPHPTLHPPHPTPHAPNTAASSAKIAIIGLGCRFPHAPNPAAFWQLLANGIDGISEVPADRWDIAAFYAADGAPGKMNTRWGGFLDQVDQFDPHFFGISPREAARMDPQQRLLLETAWEALEHGGVANGRLAHSRTGVFIGVSSYDYSRLQFSHPTHIDAYAGTGNAHSIIANRLSYLLDLRGPSLAVDTACSSSLVAVHLALQSLRSGESDMALAGGVNLLLAPELTVTFSQANMMAANGRCKTFDATADGYVRGEGCGVVVLKRLDDALRDGDNVLAIIHGSAVNQDGRSNGLTAPNGLAQQAVIRQALANANLQPHDIGYIEAHGTGTPLGDPIEVHSLRALFDPAPASTPRPTPLYLGSVKTNIGHLEAAAGIAGLIKTVLALHHQTIPAHLHFHELNPYIKLDGSPLRITTQPQPWLMAALANAAPRYAGVSSFGFGGTNAHVIVGGMETGRLGDWEIDGSSMRSGVGSDNHVERGAHLVTISAKSAESLRANVRQLAEFVATSSENLADIAYSSNNGRFHHPHRLALTATTPTDLHTQLTTNPIATNPITTLPKIAFLFTGQGSQYPHMARDLYETHPTFRAILDNCDQILRPFLPTPLLELIFAEENAPLPPRPPAPHPLHETAYTQPALFAIEYALAKLWQSWGIQPAALLGHSVGEYVAACLAGVFSLEDGLRLIATRGKLMQALPPGGVMTAVFAPEATVAPLIPPFANEASIATINGTENIVISGTETAVSTITAQLEAQGIRTRPLTVSHAFHSPLMEPMLDEFTAVASQITYHPPTIPLISNLTGQLHESAPTATYWRDHLRHAVRFSDGLTTLAAHNITAYLEIGPQTTLTSLARRTLSTLHSPLAPSPNPPIFLPSLSPSQNDWQTLLNSLGQLYEAGAEVDWAAFDSDYQRRKVTLPTYAFNRQRYWLDVTPTTQTTTTAVSPTTHLQKLPTAVPIYQLKTNWDADLPDFPHLLNQENQVNQRPILPFLHQVATDYFGAGNHSVTTDHRPQTTNPQPPSVVRRPSSVVLQALLTPTPTGATYQLFAQPSGSEEWHPLGSGQLERGEVVANQSPTNPTRADLLAADDPQTAVTHYLHTITATILGLDPARLNPNQPLDTVGMDSLMAIELRNQVERQLATSLPLVSFLTGPSVNGLAAQLVTQLAQAETAVSPIPTLPNRSGEQPLTPSQQAMWFLHQLLPAGVAFNVFGAVTVRGSFDGEAMRTALGQLVARHPALRTTFRFSREMEPVQLVREAINLPFYPLDGSDWHSSKVQEYLQAEANRPFDLEKGPLFRLITLRRAADDHILLLSVNHLITDFWSMSLLVAELTQLYTAARSGETAPLPTLSHHFIDYVHWQNQMLASDEGARLKAYWLNKLSGELPRLDLPSDRPRRAQPDYSGQTLTHRFDPALLPALKQVAQAHGVTLYTALLAGFQALLHRYSGQEEILVGSVLAGRDRPELTQLAGYFVNPVALAAQFNVPLSFADLLGQVRQTVLGAFEHQAYPLPKLAADLSQAGQIRLDPGRPPLFDVMFIMQQAQVMADAGLSALALGLPGAQLALGDATLEIHHVGGLPAQFDLTLMMAETPDGLAASLHYATALFDESTMRRLLTHLEMLLAAAVAHPQRPLTHLPLLTPAETAVLTQLNQTAMDYPRQQTIHGLIQAQAAKTPEKTAVVFQNHTLTYAQLDQRSSQLAHYLQTQGVTSGSLVALCVERSANMLVGLLGILKAGGTYIPLDPAFPPHRLALMLDDAQPALLLTETAVSPTLPTTLPHHHLDTITLHSPLPTLPLSHSPNLPAYVIYTSGSTGRPKGVAVTHRSVVNFLTSMAQQPGLTAVDILVAVTTLSFDIAGLELFLPLTVGGTVVVASRETAVDAHQLAQLLQTSQATVMQATPATWQMLLEAGWEGQDTLKILCGGEALPRQLADKLLVRGAELWNLYGPTETTIWSTCRQIFADDQPVTIGKPIANTQIYVLDGQMQPVPLGAVGDLYIGGDGVAVGYLNRPELTAERFITDAQRGRLYKTGDLARILPNGDIIFLGRNDFQVKIRGYRIELGDIEAALEKETAVSQAIVIAREDKPQPKRLVAYYTLTDGQPEPAASDLRQALQTTLPDYMLPAQFVRLAQWPLTPNGKIDRKALPAPTFSREALGSYVPPRDDIEAEVAALCAAVLGVAQIGIHDSFFDLGGNSLLATQLIFQVRSRYQVQIPLRLVFGQPTVAGLAKIVRRGGADVLAIDAMEVQEMLADARLNPAIHVNGQPKPAPAQPRHILLTGATGFLGAYLLHDLLELTNATVHCLIRAKSETDALARLVKNMQFYQQWNPAHANRIHIVLGNLAEPKLGLSDRAFGQLAEQVDVIYHNGAMVNMVYSYGAHKEANVGGTEAILTLASQTRLKPVHFVSTLAIFNRAEANGSPFHEGQRATDLPVPMGGYAQSKWVAERLVQTAVDRGIPVAIYRPGVISGDSRTGFANSDDMVSTLAQACLSLGIVPDLDVMVNITPVDFVSRALVELSQKPSSLGQIFHLANWQPMAYQELLTWIETLGYALERISFTGWRDRLVSLAPTLEEMAGWVPALPLIEEATAEQVFMPAFDYHNTITGLADTPLTCPPVGSELLTTYLLYYGQQVDGGGD